MKKILLVDDDKDFINFVEQITKGFTIKLIAVRTLKSATSYVTKSSFDLYIIDGYLLDGHGLKLISFIRNKISSTVPIIFVSSGYNDLKSFTILKNKFNVDYVINKPVKNYELKHILKQITKKEDDSEDDYLIELKKNYRKTILSKVTKIHELIKKIKDEPNIENISNLKQTIHKIGGSAGSYGYPLVSKICKKLEIFLKKQIDHNSTIDKKFFMELLVTLRNIKVAFQLSFSSNDVELYHFNLNDENEQNTPLIFLVDDDPDLTTVLKNAFEIRGFKVKTAENRTEALSIVSNFKPDWFPSLILLDRELQDIDGLEIIRKIPDFVKNKIPILFLSSKNTEEDVLMGLQAGATDYITKPFSLSVLMTKVIQMLKK